MSRSAEEGRSREPQSGDEKRGSVAARDARPDAASPPEGSSVSNERRRFLMAGAAAGLAASAGTLGNPRQAQAIDERKSQESDPFTLRFAPHPGMFSALAGRDLLDQIRFAHDQGFTAWEQNGMPNETPQMQEKIGKLLEQLGMKMGVFVAYGSFDRPTFAVRKPEYREEVLSKVRGAIEIAKRCGATHCTVVPGSVDQQAQGDGNWNRYGGPRLAEGYQLANAIGLLRECAEILEPHGLTMVLEPLNWEANHGGVFLRYSDQAYALCKAVDSPSCKILFDIYHQQITEGNLIPNIDHCWDEIGYFQSGDNPGRKEPGTGEIHYGNVFKFIHERQQKTGDDFVIGMEHGNSQPGEAGEQAVIDAYRAVEPK